MLLREINIVNVSGENMTDTEVVQNYPTNFETWIDEFNDWQTRIGFDHSWMGDYRFDI